MNPLAVCGFAVVSVGAITVIKKVSPEVASLAAAAAGIAVFVYCADGMASFFAEVRGYASDMNAERYFAVMLKALAMTFCCRMSAEICRDCGEGSLADKVELAGKAGIVIISFPIVKQLLDAAKDLM